MSSVATIPAAGAFSFVPGGGSDVVALVLTLMGSYTLPIALWRWHANSP